MAENISKRILRQIHSNEKRAAHALFATPDQQIAEIFRAESSRRGRGGHKRPAAVVR